MGSRAEYMKQCNNSKSKWNKELNFPKKQNKMIFSIAKRYGSCGELKNIKKIKKIKKIRTKASKKRCNSSIIYSSDYSVSDSSISRDNDWYTLRHPDGRKERNGLNHVVTDNINTNEDQLNEYIYNDTKFDTTIFNLSSGTRETWPVVIVTLLRHKQHRATTVAGLTWLWYSEDTNITIKKKHIK